MKQSLSIVAISVLAAATCAFSQPAAADEAKDEYEQGVAAFKNEQYKEAAAAFRRAHELKPSWKLLYNIGQSEAAAKRHGLALEAFESYLSQGGDDVPDARREEVLGELDRLRKMTGAIQVTAPKGAKVFIDGVERGQAPLLGKLPVSSGVQHNAWATLGEKRTAEQAFKVMGGDTIMVTLELGQAADATEPGPEPGPEPTPEPAPAAEETSGLKTAGWVTLGVGAAMVIGGGIAGGLALKQEGELRDSDDCQGDSCLASRQGDIDKLGNVSLAADVLLFVGGAAAATGIVLLIVSGGEDEEAEGKDADIALTPTLAPGFAGAAIQGRF